MAMGIRRPGFQLLSLISTIPSPDHITQMPVPPPLHAPCSMPDQLGIYLYIYIPLVLLTLLVLLTFNIVRANGSTGRKHSRQGTPEALRELSRGSSSHTADADSFLPTSVNKSREHHTPVRGRSYSSPWTWRFTLGGHRRRIALPNPFGNWSSRVDHRMPQRDVGVLVGLLQDVGMVAWPPIFVFLGISLWVMQW